MLPGFAKRDTTYCGMWEATVGPAGHPAPCGPQTVAQTRSAPITQVQVPRCQLPMPRQRWQVEVTSLTDEVTVPSALTVT
jgi:hypothetical protein